MLSTNYILLRIRQFFLSPFLPLLLGLILFTLYSLYFGLPILCEGNETVYDLKFNLITETHKHRMNIINYEMLMDTYNLMTARPTNQRNFEIEV